MEKKLGGINLIRGDGLAPNILTFLFWQAKAIITACSFGWTSVINDNALKTDSQLKQKIHHIMVY